MAAPTSLSVPRMAYDSDGSAVVWWSSGATASINQLSQAQLDAINNETDSDYIFRTNFAWSAYDIWVAVLFPELRDVSGWYLSTDSPHSTEMIQTSVDTITGQDGTWVDRVLPSSSEPVETTFFTDVNAVSWAGVKGLRVPIRVGAGSDDLEIVRALHLYGNPTDVGDVDFLRFWDPSLNQELSFNNIGSLARGANDTIQFRIKNESNLYTASGITVSLDLLTDASPTFEGQLQLSTDDVVYGPSVEVASLGVNSISSVLYAKLDLDVAAQLGQFALRLNASADSWTLA